MKLDADVVLADHDGLTRIGLEGVGGAGEDNPNDLPHELGLFSGELGFVLLVVIGGGADSGTRMNKRKERTRWSLLRRVKDQLLLVFI